MRKIVILAGAAVLAAFAATQAIGTAAAKLNPELALRVMPGNGEAHVQLSMLELQQAALAGGGKPPAGTMPDYLREALQALATEPTSAQAVRQLALAREFAGDKAAAGKLMLLGEQLSKRDDGINMWLINHYLTRGELVPALSHYDRILRTSNVAAPVLVPKLSQSLQQPAVIAPLAKVLAGRPPWAREFWFSVLVNPASLPNAAKLRIALADLAVPVDEDIDTRLIGAVNFADGEALYHRLAPHRAEVGVLLSRGDLAAVPKLPPYDWAFPSNGLQTGSISPEQREMVISGAPGNAGVAASRRLRLDPGTYALTVSADAGADAPRLTALVTCAEGGGKGDPIARFDANGGKIAGQFAITAPCQFYRLDLSLAVSRTSDVNEVTVSDIALHKL